MKKRQIFLVIPAKASSGGFAPDILPILTATTTDPFDPFGHAPTFAEASEGKQGRLRSGQVSQITRIMF